MEDKLLELKDQFCKWYCPNKTKEEITCKRKQCIDCPPIEQVLCCGEECSICMVSEFIRYIRDELK